MPVKEIVTPGDTSVVTTRADIIFPIAILPTTIDTIHIPIGIAATLTVAGCALVSFLISRSTWGRNRRHFMPINTYASTRSSLGAPRYSLPAATLEASRLGQLPNALKKIAKLLRGRRPLLAWRALGAVSVTKGGYTSVQVD
jgi:hypothetical protein